MFSRELKVCGRHGHLTFQPDEPAAAERLRADTSLGPAWRCLRCGDWVLGDPMGSGPAAEAPVPARGRALRQLAILRVLAVERVARGVVLVAAAYGVYRFSSAEQSLRESFGRLIPAARPLARQLGVDLDSSSLVHGATKALQARHGTLTLVAVGLLLYGVLEAVEGIGLWLAKRWAEYLTVLATAAFLPIEIRELIHTVTVTKLGALIVNIIAVAYLVIAKRLFGVRGGQARYERELAGQSLLEIDDAGHDAAYGEGGAQGRERGRDVGMSDVAPSRAERPTNRI
ncbi:MAG: DUF2127 domain-containing protein [Actinomycetota bacterium]